MDGGRNFCFFVHGRGWIGFGRRKTKRVRTAEAGSKHAPAAELRQQSIQGCGEEGLENTTATTTTRAQCSRDYHARGYTDILKVVRKKEGNEGLLFLGYFREHGESFGRLRSKVGLGPCLSLV
mmetsp:Transcript_15462/g.38494  ORF Transcript_15462/g.38494 Transcript_15462/m.38494 type:complete len:123 (-) Transcript_15462:509-877(-)